MNLSFLILFTVLLRCSNGNGEENEYSLLKATEQVKSWRIGLEKDIANLPPLLFRATDTYLKQVQKGEDDDRCFLLGQKIEHSIERLTKKTNGLWNEELFNLAIEYNRFKSSWFKLRAIVLRRESVKPSVIYLKFTKSPEYAEAADRATVLSQYHEGLVIQHQQHLENYRRRVGTGVIEINSKDPVTKNHGRTKLQNKADMVKATNELKSLNQKLYLIVSKKKNSKDVVNVATANELLLDLSKEDLWVPKDISYSARQLSELPDKHFRSKEFLELARAFNEYETMGYELRAVVLGKFFLSQNQLQSTEALDQATLTKYERGSNEANARAERHRLIWYQYEEALENYKPSSTPNIDFLVEFPDCDHDVHFEGPNSKNDDTMVKVAKELPCTNQCSEVIPDKKEHLNNPETFEIVNDLVHLWKPDTQGPTEIESTPPWYGWPEKQDSIDAGVDSAQQENEGEQQHLLKDIFMVEPLPKNGDIMPTSRDEIFDSLDDIMALNSFDADTDIFGRSKTNEDDAIHANRDEDAHSTTTGTMTLSGNHDQSDEKTHMLDQSTFDETKQEIVSSLEDIFHSSRIEVGSNGGFVESRMEDSRKRDFESSNVFDGSHAGSVPNSVDGVDSSSKRIKNGF